MKLKRQEHHSQAGNREVEGWGTQASSRLLTGWASQAEAGGTKLLSELETGWPRIKLPQTVEGQEARELELRPGALPPSVDRNKQ